MKYKFTVFGIVFFCIFSLHIGCAKSHTKSPDSGTDSGNQKGVSLEKNILITLIEEKLTEKKEELFEIYRDLHSHPEVSGQEERTAGVIADRLVALDLEVQTGIGGHGVIGILRGEKEGPVVAYRADMDAVMDGSPDPVEFRSETPGVRHICGHDAHVTIALGIAEALSSIRQELPGTVKFIFQPAEENASGARAMIAEGVLENPAPQAILAVHCAPLETGQITGAEGLMLAGFDLITVTFQGEGDLKTAAQAAAKLISSVSSGNLRPPQDYLGETAAAQDNSGNDFTFAMLAGFEEKPEEKKVILRGLIRASSEENFAKAKTTITYGLTDLGVPDVSHTLDYIDRAVPAVMNDPELVRSAADTIRVILGEEGLVEMGQVPPYFSEDFAHYLQKIPGVLYFLGVSNTEKGIIGMPHSPQFAVDLDAILIGAKTMAAVLLDHLELLK